MEKVFYKSAGTFESYLIIAENWWNVITTIYNTIFMVQRAIKVFNKKFLFIERLNF